jgi:hypothetical protein
MFSFIKSQTNSWNKHLSRCYFNTQRINILKYMPRSFFIFLLNNHCITSKISDSTQQSKLDWYIHQKTILLKKKTPVKLSILNFITFYNTFYIKYRYNIISATQFTFNIKYEPLKYPGFFYLYSLNIFFLNLSNKFT